MLKSFLHAAGFSALIVLHLEMLDATHFMFVRYVVHEG